MLRQIEPLKKNYWINEENFGTVRMGDTIGIAAFLELIRFQFNKNIHIYLPKGHLASDLPLYLNNYFSMIYDFSLMKQFPYSGNIWGWYDYAYKYYDICPKISNPHLTTNFPMLKICINPLFDAPYSVDRNWKPELLQKIVNRVLEEYPTNGNIVVIASPTITLPDLPEKIKIVQNTLSHAVKEIMTSDIYIGGETGLTHFAFQLERNPKIAICLRGERVEQYTESLTIKDKPKIFSFITVPEGQDYAFEVSTLPRPSRDKKGCTLTMLEGDCPEFFEKIDYLIEFPAPAKIDTLYEIREGGIIMEFGSSGKTVELAAAAVKNNAELISVASSYSVKLRKAEELHQYNLYTNRIKLICEDEEQFRKNWVDTGRQWDLLIEGE